MNEELLQHKVRTLEEGQECLEVRVMDVERTQSGLVEAVRGVKDSVDKLTQIVCWGVKLFVGGLFTTGLGVLVKLYIL